MLTFDFETFPITTATKRTGKPPEPVGVAINDTYYHWGHMPVERWRGRRGVDVEGFLKVGRALNRIVQCTKHQASRILTRAVSDSPEVLGHNLLYDIQVAIDHLGVPRSLFESKTLHDTQWLLFLIDPNARLLGLKPSAERWLDMPPASQDAMKDWLVAHVGNRTPHERDVLGMSTPKQSPSTWTAFAPPRIAGRYAIDDVKMTARLFKKLRPIVTEWRMDAAYDRYQRAFWMIFDLQRRGIHIDTKLAKEQNDTLLVGIECMEEWIRKRLDRPDLNLNAPKQLREALKSAKVMDEHRWNQYKTDSGELSVAKNALEACCADPQLHGAITYYNKATFNQSTFTSKWTDEIWYVDYSLTRSDTGGSRTGRLAASPNPMNLSKKAPVIATRVLDAIKLATMGEQALVLDHRLANRVDELPELRTCIVPGKGRAFADLDYSQQELRILAHYAGGSLARTYIKHPGTDMHAYAGEQIEQRTSQNLSRTRVKGVAFGIIYSSGLALQARQVGLDPDDPESIDYVKGIRAAYYEGMPEVAELQREWTKNPKYAVTTKKMLVPETGRLGRTVAVEPIYTIGGRICFVEEPAWNRRRKKMMSFEYKTINTAVQGSAGDQLLEAMIDLWEAGIDIEIPVHDQTLISDTKRRIRKTAREAVHILEHADSGLKRPVADGGVVDFDIPMLADADIRMHNWAEKE